MINVDKNAAYLLAIEEFKKEKVLEEKSKLKQVKYLNNRIEQDPIGRKRITKISLGYQCPPTAWRTIRGIEIMHTFNKSQVDGVSHRANVSQKEFVELLFEMAA